MNFKLGELFCGPGGMALGALLAAQGYQKKNKCSTLPIEHVWGVDKDPKAINTYNRNFNLHNGVGYNLDAYYFCKSKVAEIKKINALAFGFPCNDFSLVGEKNGLEGKYGNLYKAGIKVINIADPIWFVAENVSGINSANQGKAFEKIKRDLEKAGNQGGYYLDSRLYKFEEYGVPQMRHRYIIIGIQRKYADKYGIKYKAPIPTKKRISASEALSDIADEAYNNDFPVQTERIVKRLQFIPPWGNAWFLDDLLEMNKVERGSILRQYPWFDSDLSHLSDEEVQAQIAWSKLNCEKARMSHIYKRLHPDKPSYTITGSGGGGTHVYHWNEHRALTNRERARLQSFPDWFEFIGSKEQVRKQIGMAVPPEGAKIIFESIIDAFAESCNKLK